MLASARGDPMFGIQRHSIEGKGEPHCARYGRDFYVFCVFLCVAVALLTIHHPFLRIQGWWRLSRAKVIQPWRTNIVDLLTLSA